jgi:hypothetical protein
MSPFKNASMIGIVGDAVEDAFGMEHDFDVTDGRTPFTGISPSI